MVMSNVLNATSSDLPNATAADAAPTGLGLPYNGCEEPPFMPRKETFGIQTRGRRGVLRDPRDAGKGGRGVPRDVGKRGSGHILTCRC